MGTLICTGPLPWWVVSSMASLIRRLQNHSSSSVCTSGRLTGHTDIYVNLRCMEIKPGEAILYAGGGILASSEVESEWMETGDKMNTMRSILHPDFISK